MKRVAIGPTDPLPPVSMLGRNIRFRTGAFGIVGKLMAIVDAPGQRHITLGKVG